MESATKGKAKRRHLSAEECGNLGRSPEGTHALTQPHSVVRSNSIPNLGLLPRTPTKKKRRDGTDKRQQKGITDFFPVIGTVRVSPQKTAQPSTPVKTERLNGVFTPKKDPEPEEEAFTTPIKEEPPEEMVDYLEGLTEAMYGDDEEFERCAGAGQEDPDFMFQEEDEVDALPDAHYGLLGTSKGLVQPQGHVEDLPEEILMLVFGLLPAEDLYCHVSLVCHRWRDIITQPLFVPWKKLYYRYQKKESEAVKEISSILKANSITKDDDLSVINLVRFMAQYKPSQRVKPDAVLQSVRSHSLFPQAEACLKHRFPQLEGIEEGPNPWAAMALILVLSDSVGDVQDLVARLRSCMPTHSIITEYLSAVATLLLAMRNNNISISNRWHYNIFYVLHLMENAPPTAITNQSGRPQCQVTHEQQQILNHDIQNDHMVKIMAFAGTGKTTTLVRYAQQRPHIRFLYVAFNKSVATAAQRLFPSNVDCRTVHSMAFGAVGKKYQERKKLSSNVKSFSVACVLPEGRGGFVNAKVVTLTLNAYMASVDPHITSEHVPLRYKDTHGNMQLIGDDKKMLYVDDAQKIWDKMVDLGDMTREPGYHMSCDGYLKLWQLQKPCLDKYDVIFIDEAQDCTPAIMDIMLSQRCGKILVGDPHQQIYTFRGAVNALHLVTHTHLYYLTQSFRFGAEIAYIGATILHVCKKVKKILVGGKQEGSVRGTTTDTLDILKSGLSPEQGKIAILSRSNAIVFDEAVKLTTANPHCTLHIVGGVENFGLKKILDIWLLMQPENNWQRIQDSFIRNFARSTKLGGYHGLKKYATDTEDRELEAKLAMVEKYNSRIPELVERIYHCTESNHQNADFILGTVHKSKGLEFDTVVVTDDFAKVPCARHNLGRLSGSSADVPEDEWNLLYVAVTRAKSSLIITKHITNMLTLAGEYFLRSELTSALLTEGQPPLCSVRECQNYIMADSAIAMRKLPIQYMESADSGGPVCESCVWQRVGPTACLLAPPEKLQTLPQTQERLELPINYAMLLALF